MYNLTTNKTDTYNMLQEAVREPFDNYIQIGVLNSGTFTAAYTIRGIRSLSITQNACNSTEVSIGGFPCNEISAEFDADSAAVSAGYVYKDKIVCVYCGVTLASGTVTYIPCGYFKISEVESDNDYVTVKIKGYDVSNDWTDTYADRTTSTNKTAKEHIDAICSAHGITVDYGNVGSDSAATLLDAIYTSADDSKILSMLVQMTEREVIAQLCGMIGANARINTINKLHIGFFEQQSFYITEDVQWQNGLIKKADEAFTIKSITSKDNTGSSDSYTKGDGKGITFSNDLASNAQIDSIYTRLYGKSYFPCEVEWRGNPCYEAGDAVYAKYKSKDLTVYITSQTLDLVGGLSMVTTCPLANDSFNFDSKAYTDNQITQTKTEYQDAILKATEKINGSVGGYVQIADLDGDEKPDTIFITENEIGADGKVTTGKVIKMNKDGIGLGENGMDGAFTTAITGKEIDASVITTGTMSADRVRTGKIEVKDSDEKVIASWDLENGEFISGSGNYVYIPTNGALEWYNNYLRQGYIAPTNAGMNLYYDRSNAGSMSFGYEQKSGGKIVLEQGIVNIADYYDDEDDEDLKDKSGGILTVNGTAFSGVEYLKNDVGLKVKLGVGASSQTNSLSFADCKYSSVSMMPTSSQNRPSAVPSSDIETYYGRIESKGKYYYSLTDEYYCTSVKTIRFKCTHACWGYSVIGIFFRFADSSKNQQIALEDDWNKTSVVSIDKTVTVPTGAQSYYIYTYADGGDDSYWSGIKNVTWQETVNINTGSVELYNPTAKSTVARIDVTEPRYNDTIGRIRVQSASGTSSWFDLGTNGEIGYLGRTLRFGSDGLYYNDTKLKFDV